jgi:ligand-binding sensor domain-containing protein
VLAVLEDRDGSWWFGTQSGLSHQKGGQWQTYRAADFGLMSDQIQHLAQDSRGRIWVATKAGAAVLESNLWTAFTSQNSPLPDDAVFTIAVQNTPASEVIWLGTLPGVSRLDLATNMWSSTDLSAYGLGWGGVADVLVDSQGNVWAATLGGGVSVWNGVEWTSYRSSNSQLPKNSVQRMLEVEPGVFWFGLANMSEPGGMMASYDGTTWKSYHPLNSGFTGAEPLALAKDQSGRLWIGTNLSGVIIYQPQK